MSYLHLSSHDRNCIFHQQLFGLSNAEIARRQVRHRSTIGRELRRFDAHPSWPAFGRYFPDSAQAMAVARRTRIRGFRWTGRRSLLAYVLIGLRQEWSPEQIAGRIVRDYPEDLQMRIGHSSIYRYIRADRVNGGLLWKRLRQSRKRRRRAYGTGPRPPKIPDRLGIENRPLEAESRTTAGHWEADTVLGVRGRLATCVERRSRYLLVGRMPDGTATEFNAAAIRLFRRIPRHHRKTFTSDNGSEFVKHKLLASRLGFQTFFADPYSAWQRGTNENTNGLLRQYFPKKHDFSTTSRQRVARIARKLNNRPRKCLAYRTPAEVFGSVLQLQ